MERLVNLGSRASACALALAIFCAAGERAGAQTVTHDPATKTVSITGSDDPSRADVFIVDLTGTRLTITYGSGATGSTALVVPASQVILIAFDLKAGNDWLTVPSTLAIPLNGTGGDGDDTVMAGAAPDRIEGGNGNDTISTFGGNDVVIGGDGNDIIVTSEGADIVYGYVPLASDWIQPTEFLQDNDIIDAGRGPDYIEGGPAIDKITAGDDRDTVHGFIPLVAGYTPPFEYHDADEIDGGSGDDTIYGGPSNDQIHGGLGNDTIEGYIPETVFLRLPTCSDTDKIWGDGGNDTIGGGPWGDEIDAGVGDDTVRAGTGTDTVYGQNGIDYIYGGEDNDTLYGGAGVDHIWGEDGDDYIACGSGSDTAFGGPGNDEIWGNDDPNTLYGEEGNDTINGGSSNDFIDAGNGNDTVLGLAGNDYIDGGNGRDSLTGNAGDDYILAGVSDSDFDSLQGSSGNDKLFGSAGGDRLNGGDGNDLLVSLDQTTSNTVIGGAGEDSFWIDRRTESGSSTTDTCDATATETDSNLHLVDDLLGDADYTWDGDDLDDPAGGEFYRSYSDLPLFPAAGCAYPDVNQGALGDCWLLSALSSMAYAAPQAIEQAVLELPDRTYIVDYSSHHIRVDGQLPHTDGTYEHLPFAGISNVRTGDGHLWVAILEKAVAMYRIHIGAISVWEDYDSLEGGIPGAVYSDFRVERRSLFESIGDELLTWTAQSLAAWVDAEIDAGNCVSFCTRHDDAALDPTFVSAHCYAILEVARATAPGFDEDGEPYSIGDPIALRLYNPWGTDGGTSDDGSNDGELWVTVKQFKSAAWLSSAMFGVNVGDPSAFR